MKVNILQAILQNLPTGLRGKVAEGDFAGILAQLMEGVQLENLEGLDLKACLGELADTLLENQDQEEEEADLNLLFNPIHMPWIYREELAVNDELLLGDEHSLLETTVGGVDSPTIGLVEDLPVKGFDQMGDELAQIQVNFTEQLEEVLEVDGLKEGLESLDKPSVDFTNLDREAKFDKAILGEGSALVDDLQFKSEKLDELAVGEELDSLSLKEEDKEIRNKNIAKEGSLFNQLDVRFDNLSTEVELEVADVAEQVDFRENIESINDKIIEFMDLNRDENSVRLKLHPEELGYVDLNLKMEEGKLVVKILVENEAARDLFNSNLNQLNNNLLRQDIVLGRVDIELSLNSNNPSANSNSRNQGNRPYRTSRIQFSKESPAVSYINDLKESGLNILA